LGGSQREASAAEKEAVAAARQDQLATGDQLATREQVITGEQVPSEDQRLIAAVLGKDRKATAEFVSRYADAVYRYVYSRLVPRTDQVDDVVQEVFLAAWENLTQYRGNSSLQSWLLGIARHKVADYYRAHLREPEPAQPSEEKPGLEPVSADFSELVDSELQRKKTWQALTRLPEKYRVVLLWRYWEKCSAREMAARVGRTEKAIERLLARAREEFRREWNHE
jgi:RNA polymerase sigma-70 factor (ECF subfamily)